MTKSSALKVQLWKKLWNRICYAPVHAVAKSHHRGAPESTEVLWHLSRIPQLLRPITFIPLAVKKKKKKKGYKNSPSTSLGTGFLFHIDMIASQRCCRSVRCTSMIWNSHSSISQRCSLGLRSGGGGGHLSTAISLLYSRNQFEIIWALWPGTLSLVDYTLLPKRDGYNQQE